MKIGWAHIIEWLLQEFGHFGDTTWQVLFLKCGRGCRNFVTKLPEKNGPSSIFKIAVGSFQINYTSIVTLGKLVNWHIKQWLITVCLISGKRPDDLNFPPTVFQLRCIIFRGIGSCRGASTEPIISTVGVTEINLIHQWRLKRNNTSFIHY